MSKYYHETTPILHTVKKQESSSCRNSWKEKRGQAGFMTRDKPSFDIFRIRGESLEESDGLPDLDVLNLP